MPIRYVVFLSLLIFCCCGKRRKKEDLNGIWIPEVVDWKEGSFDTYYIKDDTVVIISSEQKMINDSIYFRTEPGLNLMKGILRPVADGKFLLPRRTLYRFIKVSGVKADELFTHTISVVPSKDSVARLIINGINYIQGRLYTWGSREAIIGTATVMVPYMEKHPGEFEADGAPTLTSLKQALLGVDIDDLPSLNDLFSRDTVIEGDEGVSWKGRAWYAGRQLVVLAETSWEDVKRIHRVTVFGPQIKEGALFVGQRVKDISGLVSGTIPSGPDGYLFLAYKKDKAISIQLDISGVPAGSRLVTGVSEMADVPDSLRVESLVIMGEHK